MGKSKISFKVQKMAEKKLVTADDFTNPRGNEISKPELLQALADIAGRFKKYAGAHNALSNSTPADADSIKKAQTTMKLDFPEHLVTLYEKYNGRFNLNNWETYTLEQICDSQKELCVNATWKNGFIPIGHNSMEDNWMIIDTSEGGQ